MRKTHMRPITTGKNDLLKRNLMQNTELQNRQCSSGLILIEILNPRLCRGEWKSESIEDIEYKTR